MSLVDHHIRKAANQIAKVEDMTALGFVRLWYVRSTGEIIGPNWGKRTGKHNKKRNAIGNLFENERDAKKAAKYIKLVLKLQRWLP